MAEIPVVSKTGLSLFWRTFALLSLLIFCSALAWLQLLRTQEYEPRMLRNAHQIASVVNLIRTALMHTDEIARVSLLKMLADEEDVSISTREPSDSFEPFGQSELEVQIGKELVKRLGQSTIIASKVNDSNGLWVGFQIEKDSYWLLMDPERLNTVSGSTWLVWLLTASALSLAGAALIARLINRPLRQLSVAASRVRDGNFTASPLDEHVTTSEIREVNIGFNRMAERLAKIEQERALMLAGFFHALPHPLAPLTLEAELPGSGQQGRPSNSPPTGQPLPILTKFPAP